MSTKAQLVQLDETNIKTNPSKIVPLNHSVMNNALIDEFFTAPKTEKSDTISTNTILNETISGYTYDITFKKVGNTVFVNGKITNFSGTPSGINLVGITNIFYKPKDSDVSLPNFSATKWNFSSSTGIAVHLTIDSESKFKIVNTALNTSEYIVFNGVYFTND